MVTVWTWNIQLSYLTEFFVLCRVITLLSEYYTVMLIKFRDRVKVRDTYL